MKTLKQSQVSVEYLMIIAFALVLTIPVVAIFFSQSSDLTDKVNLNQASRVAKQIVSSAEKVFFIGVPSQTIVRIDMPENIDEILISEKEFLIKLNTQAGISEVYEVALVNMTGNISTSPGTKHLLVKAQPGVVNISEV